MMDRPHIRNGDADIAEWPGDDAWTGYRYRAFGLTVVSDFEIEELVPAGEVVAADVHIRYGKVEWPGQRLPVNDFRFGPGCNLLHWDAVGTFLVDGADSIVVDPAPGVDTRLLSLPLLGPVFGLLLHLRGLLVLHASAVAVGSTAAVFMGDKGAGKSTTAGALIAAGHRLVTDDVVAIDLAEPASPKIRPGFPQLKLTDDAARSLTLSNTDVKLAPHPAIGKKQHRLTSSFDAAELPLTRIYVLERGDVASISVCEPGEALRRLIQFSYIVRFGRTALGDRAAAHMADCSRLVGGIGVRMLGVPSRLDRLGEAVKAVERDMRAAVGG
jgi:hypothetical protein